MNHKRKVNDMDSPTEPAIENDKNVDMYLRGDGLKYVKQLEAEKKQLKAVGPEEAKAKTMSEGDGCNDGVL